MESPFVRLVDIPYGAGQHDARHAAAKELAAFINEMPDGYYHMSPDDCSLAVERMLAVYSATLRRQLQEIGRPR